MKKTLKVFALTALAFTMIFTSCKKDVKPNIDVVQVEASKITVEAYPCENRISWTPVSNADYALYRNGSKLNINADKPFIYVDKNIVDGVEYEYKIITTPKADFEIKNEFGDQVTALGGSNKTAYYTKGNSASAKVTAIVPATTITSKDGVTTAITAADLIDFDKKAKKGSKVTADNFVFGLKDNYFYYSFPAVDYLDYYVSCYRGNEKDYILFYDAVSNIEGPYNGKAKSKLITEPGDYTLVLVVSKAGYADTIIEAKTPITVKTLDVKTATGTPSAQYINDGKTARITWVPATKADASKWAPANYKVYLVSRDNTYTDTALTVAEDKSFGKYYVDYTVPEGEENLTKTFVVVLSSEDGIESGKKSCTLTSKNIDVKESTSGFTVKYIAPTTACLYWTPAKMSDKTIWPAENYTLYSIDENDIWTPLSEGVKIESKIIDGNDCYCVNLEIANPDIINKFGLQLSDGEKKEDNSYLSILTPVDIDVFGGITGAINVDYIDSKTACLYWTPAKKQDQTIWPIENYTVYSVSDKGVWSAIDVKIEKIIRNAVDYYSAKIELDNTDVAYTFGVQLSDGAKKEEGKTVYLSADTIDVVSATTGLNVAYVPNSDVARVWWTPATKENGDNWPAANYNVYSVDENGFWTKETVDIKSAINNGKDVYYVEFNIEDTTEAYTYGIELADGDKKESVGRLSCTLYAKDRDIDVSTGNPSAKYISEDTVRIWWTPATKKSDESEWALANYTVYVKDENGFCDTIKDIEVKEDSKVGDVVYYVEYTVEDNEKDYTFEVVLTIDGDYVDTPDVTVSAYKLTETTVFNGYVNTNLASFDNTDLFANDAVLSITLADDEKVDFVKYKVLNDSADFIFPEEALLDSAFVELTVAENYNGANKFIVKDLKEGDKVVFLYSIVEEDKEPIYDTATTDVVDTSGVTRSINIAPTFNRADNKSNVTVSFDLSTTSLKDYENWTVQIFYAKLNNKDNSVVWKEIKVPPFALNADKDKYVAKTTEETLVIDTEVGYDPFDGDFDNYEDTYAIKYVYTCEGVSEPKESVITTTLTKERQ